MRRALLSLPLMSCALFDGGQPRPFPTWGVHGAARPAGVCATVEPWVVKSGAEGLGIVVEVRGRSSCALAMSVLEMRLPDEALQRSIALPPAQMTAGTTVHARAPASAFSSAAQKNGNTQIE